MLSPPGVAYGNAKDFPHSFSSMKDNKFPLHDLDIIPEGKAEEIEEEDSQKINLPSGDVLLLKRLKAEDHDPSNRQKAFELLETFSAKKETVTGLIYYKEEENFLRKTNLSEKALVDFKEDEIRPQPKDLAHILDHYK